MEKGDLTKNNIKYSDSFENTKKEKEDKISKIKEILPNVVNSDNILNIQALQDLLDITNTTANNQGYGLTFAGKGFAKAKADQPTTKELKVEMKQSKNFDTTENVIIRGDNLDVLKILKQNYYGKIKMIYIDPPYNTANDDFLYNDDFKVNEKELIEELGLSEDTINYLQNIYGTSKHSAWLSFMYPRLMLARDLLTKDGVIFISIDDNEQANLKLLCDEVFGEENFVNNIIWKKSTGKNDSTYLANLTENILLYSKQKSLLNINKKIVNKDFKYKDEKGRYNIEKLDRGGLEYRKNNDYIITAPDNSKIFPHNSESDFIKRQNGKYNSRDWQWRISKNRFEEELQLNNIEFKLVNNNWSVYTKVYEFDEVKSPYNNIIDFVSNLNGGEEIIELFNFKIFSFPKPTELIKHLLKIASSPSDIILDFFAGSGTTAHAVMDLNKEDGGNRKFILVQLDEVINEKKNKTAYDFCKNEKLVDKRYGKEPYISDITIERVNRAGDKIKNELNNNLDIDYKVFSLVEKPKLELINNQFELLNKRCAALDILYNMMSATCVELSAKVEEIEKDKLYFVNNCYYIVDKCNQDLIDKTKSIYINGYCNNINLAFVLNLKETFDNDNIKVVY